MITFDEVIQRINAPGYLTGGRTASSTARRAEHEAPQGTTFTDMIFYRNGMIAPESWQISALRENPDIIIHVRDGKPLIEITVFESFTSSIDNSD